MKTKIFIRLFLGCSLALGTLTATAQIDIEFKSPADIATGWFYTGTTPANASVVENDYLKMTRTGDNNWVTAIYKPSAGISLGGDRFIAAKTMNNQVGLKLLSRAPGAKEAVCTYAIPAVSIPGSGFYIHLFRLSDFVNASSLTPTDNLICEKISISTQNGMPGITDANPSTYIDWIKSFKSEEQMFKYASESAKFDIDFKPGNDVRNTIYTWSALENCTQPTLSADGEYMQIASKSDNKAVSSISYTAEASKSGGFLWDMTNAKVVVMKFNGATAPYLGMSSDVLDGNQTSNLLIKAQQNPQSVPNSSDKLFVYILPSSLTKYEGIQRVKVFKIYANHQSTGDVSGVDWIKTFASIQDAQNYINSITKTN